MKRAFDFFLWLYSDKFTIFMLIVIIVYLFSWAVIENINKHEVINEYQKMYNMCLPLYEAANPTRISPQLYSNTSLVEGGTVI